MWKVGTTATAASSAPSCKDGDQNAATGALSKDSGDSSHTPFSQTQALTVLSQAER